MANKFNKPSQLSSTSYGGPTSHDARSDLGYGTTKPKFQLPRQTGEQFPYVAPDNYDLDDVQIDDETMSSASDDTIDYHKGDPYANNKNNPFYFVAGNTKLADCFWRTDKVLLEISSFGDSMTSVPHAYPRHSTSLTGFSGAGGYSGAGGTNYRRTGSLQGWSKRPPQSKVAQEDENSIDIANDFEDDVFYSLQDLAKKFDENEQL